MRNSIHNSELTAAGEDAGQHLRGRRKRSAVLPLAVLGNLVEIPALASPNLEQPAAAAMTANENGRKPPRSQTA